MKPWLHLGTSNTPDQKNTLDLYQRDTEFSIRINGQELMNSRMYGSEKTLAELACKKIKDQEKSRILIGGLGMGYTLSSALLCLRDDASVIISELVPSIVEWNRSFLGDLAGQPLDDNRVVVKIKDITEILKQKNKKFHAVILDVDNGPEGLTQKSNNWLYSSKGLDVIKNSLFSGGVLAVWSVRDNDDFTHRLKQKGYIVEKHRVWARSNKKGGRHMIWLAMRR